MEKTTTKTFSIDSKLYEKFEKICKLKNLNKSAVIQSAIKKFVIENYEIDKNAYYVLKTSPNSEHVKIISKDAEFVILSNGNRLNIFDFELLYEMVESQVFEVLSALKNNYIPIKIENEYKKVDTIDNTVKEISDVLEYTQSGFEKDVANDDDLKNTTGIVKKLKEKRHEISKIIEKSTIDVLEKYDILNLEKILSYIYETDIKIEYKDDKYYINIPKKYVDINFENLLNGLKYEIVNVKEKTINEKFCELLKKINKDFSYIQEKSNHISDTLEMLVKAVSYGKDDFNIHVRFDDPIYTLTIDKKFICQELIDFISKSYGIKKDHVILNGV